MGSYFGYTRCLDVQCSVCPPPQADDYIFVRLLRDVGADSFVAHRYQTWNGRFASDVWYVAFYSIIDVVAHPWASGLIIIILFTAGAWYGYVRFLGACSAVGNARAVHRTRDAIALAGVLLFFYLLLIHTSALYGISSAVPYQVGAAHLFGQIAGLCVLVRSMCRAGTRQRRMTWRQWAGAAGLAVSALFISGYQESFVLVSLLFYGVGALWSTLHCRRTLWVWVAVCVMAAIGGIIVFVAPGNAVRIASAGDSGSLSGIISTSDPAHAPNVLLASMWRYIWISVYGIFRLLIVFFLLPLRSLAHPHDPYSVGAVHGYLYPLGAIVCQEFPRDAHTLLSGHHCCCYPACGIWIGRSRAVAPASACLFFSYRRPLAPVGASFRCSSLYARCVRRYAALCTRQGKRERRVRIVITAARYAAAVLLVSPVSPCNLLRFAINCPSLPTRRTD